MKRLLLALLSLCFAFNTIQAATYYVALGGNDANAGTNWGAAFRTVQKALNVATANDQIWVAAGTYYPDEINATNSNARNSTFQLKNDVALYGGFASGETLLSQRNIAANVTILSGDLTQNDAANFANNGENAYHVVTGSGTNNTARIDGFTITAGNANDNFPNNVGAGMYNDSDSPVVANCTFSSNQARNSGGGMYNFSSAPSIINCAFSGNQAANGGGGMFNASSSPNVINCIFTGNQANNQGGGMINTNSSLSIINCTFSGNRANNQGGGMYNFSSSLPIANTIIWNNRDNSGTGTVNASIFNISTTPTITYSLVQNITTSANNNKDGIATAANSNYPAFVTPVDPTTAPTTAGNLRLQITSPVINMGNDNAVLTDTQDVDDDGNTAEKTPDLDLNNRLVGGTAPNVVDLGAYEFSSCAAEAGLIANSLASNNLTICRGTDSGFTFSTQGETTDAIYIYVFILVNNSTGAILQASTSGDFLLTNLAVGTYTVYGLSYANFNTPSDVIAYIAGKTIAQVQTDDAGTAFCLDLTSTTVAGNTNIINVNGVSGGTIAANQTICSGGDPAGFTSPDNGTFPQGALQSYRWEASTTGCNANDFQTIPNYDPSSITNNIPAGLTQTTYYRRVAISTLNGVACEAISNCVTITVNQITPGEIGGSQTVCTTKDPAPFTSVTPATGSGTITYQWESSAISCVSGFAPVDGATAATFDPAKGQFTVTTYFRRIAISTLNGVACQTVSNCVTLTVLNVNCGEFPWNGK